MAEKGWCFSFFPVIKENEKKMHQPFSDIFANLRYVLSCVRNFCISLLVAIGRFSYHPDDLLFILLRLAIFFWKK